MAEYLDYVNTNADANEEIEVDENDNIVVTGNLYYFDPDQLTGHDPEMNVDLIMHAAKNYNVDVDYNKETYCFIATGMFKDVYDWWKNWFTICGGRIYSFMSTEEFKEFFNLGEFKI